MRLLVTGGGTGGHVYPLVAVLQQLAAEQKLNLTSEVLYIGRANGVEERIAADLQIPFAGIRVGGIRSKDALTQARNVSQMAQASQSAAKHIAHFKPNLVLATGGYVSAPVLWAAWRKKIPIVIELPDLEPGWAIRATWRLSKQVAVSFEPVLKYFGRGRATVTGYPVREEFFRVRRVDGRSHFQLDPDVPVVTVFGGSQGAHALNVAVQDNLRALLSETQIIHICGAKDWASLEAERERQDETLRTRYRVYEYLKEDMPLALKTADVIVARAGAATLGEFPAVGVPSILVPGLFAEGHQDKNADFLASRGGCDQIAREHVGARICRDGARTCARPRTVEVDGRSGGQHGGTRRRETNRRYDVCIRTMTSHIHFIGIGGAGLSALAQVMLGRGEVVSGSDPTAPSPITNALEKLGATIYANHDAGNITGADLIVTTSAAPGDNPEIIAAHLQQIPILKRRDFLREITRGYDVIAVSGSHGKTTTTAMIGLMLEAGGLDPTVVVGGIVPGWQTNARVAEQAENKWFVIEADEYDHAFLGLNPKIAVVTNVDYDHPDLFPTRETYRAAFGQFLKQTRADGVCITCADEHGLAALAESHAPRLIRFGIRAENEWRATSVKSNARGGSDFAIYQHDRFVGNASVQVPGEYNVLNALAAVVAADTAGVKIETALATLAQFGGVGRRFQVVGIYNGATLVDDYAHHPTEIRATLHGARMRFPTQRIWAVFQPHTFSRTRTLMDEFARAFGDADMVLITEIYAAREQDTSGLSARAILERMHQLMPHPNARYVENLDTAQDILRKELCPGDVLITLGAGNVNRVAHSLSDSENA